MNESTTDTEWGPSTDVVAMAHYRLVYWLDVWWDGVLAGSDPDWLEHTVAGLELGHVISIQVAGYTLDAETAYMAALSELEARG